MDTCSIPPWHFDPAKRAWTEGVGRTEAPSRPEITLATFNVWFGEHELEARCDAVLGLLRSRGADLIALQEVTVPFLKRMLQETWVRNECVVSDATGGTFPDYGVVLLSRLPVREFELHDLPSMMNRKPLLGRVNAGPADLTVAGVHLESLKECGSAREEQLQEIFRVLEPAENAVLMGDFNFCSTWEENARLDDRYVDLWPLLHPGDPGWTVDRKTNAMRRALGKSGKEVRFDRVLARSAKGALQLRSISLLGTEPVSPGRPDLLPSDHFGLTAVPRVGSNATR